MPKNYGVKEKDQVVAHVVGALLSGKLRTGDRIDRNRIARELGLSRVPVSEAIVQLEHDGIVSTQYHRGAFVERFDPVTVLEHHEVYGVLSGMAAGRAATHPSPRMIGDLSDVMDVMRRAANPKAFQDAVWAYRRTINLEHAGPRLRAAIRTSTTVIPQAFWLSYADNQATMLPHYEAEHSAIRRRDPVAARIACETRGTLMGRIVVTELVRRKVFDSTEDIEPFEYDS